MLNEIKNVFRSITPAKRKAIYGIATAVITALIAFGVITPEDLNEKITGIITALAGITTLLAYFNTDVEKDTKE